MFIVIVVILYFIVASGIAWCSGRWHWWGRDVADIAALFWVLIPVFWLGGHALNFLDSIYFSSSKTHLEAQKRPCKVHNNVTS